jgi:transposase
MSAYVGIDVHRKRSQVAVVESDGTERFNRNLRNDSWELGEVLGDLPAGTPVAFEAAFGWSWLSELVNEREL